MPNSNHTTDSNTQLIFFDIDGTLGRDGDIAPNNIDTIMQLHDKGVKMVIATGRGIAMVNDSIKDLAHQGIVDAFICMNGQLNRTIDDIISHYPLTVSQCDTIRAILAKHNIIYKLDSEKHIAWSEMSPFYEELLGKYPNFIVDPDYYQSNTVYQCSAFVSHDEQSPELEDDLAQHGLGITRWLSKGIDILPHDAGKSRGIKDICNHFGVHLENTMAFGDGLNDICMLTNVGVGIAMGDGKEQAHAVADYVTGSIEENGIYHALKHYSVL